MEGRPTIGIGRTRSGHRKRVVVVGVFMFRLVKFKSSRFLPVKGLLRRVGAKVASAFRFPRVCIGQDQWRNLSTPIVPKLLKIASSS
ncbi:hypothetical protein V6N13_149156 [Hibiscus sabdariffa]